MMSKAVFLPLSLLTLATLFLQPAHLKAASVRAPKSQISASQPAAVAPLVAGQTDIYDIDGPIPQPDAPPYLLYAALFILVLATIVIIFLVARRRRKTIPVPPPDPAELALAELEQARGLLEQRTIFGYVEEVSRILRTYMERSFHIKTSRKTTREILIGLKEQPKNENARLAGHAEDLKTCLNLCDLTKFARFLPEKESVESLTSAVRSFIETTRISKNQEG